MALALIACAGRDRHAVPAGTIFVMNDSTLLHGGIDSLQLGRMHSGEVIHREFYVRNSTGNPVVILGYETTCGCTALSYDDSPIEPGESRRMTCRFDSSGEYGQTLTVLSLNLYGTDKRHRILVLSEIH